jgi:hypothetical protein
MSRPISRVINCQKCGHTQVVTIWESVNVTLNPELRDQLIDGSLMRFVCKDCGYSVPMLYPLLYHDAKRQFMIWLWPAGGVPDSFPFGDLEKDYRFRAVRMPNWLLEKIAIFEKDFDDRLIEVFKLMAKAGTNDPKSMSLELFFDLRNENRASFQALRFVQLGDAIADSFGITREAYDRFEKIYAAKLSDYKFDSKWPYVDDRFAQVFLLGNEMAG